VNWRGNRVLRNLVCAFKSIFLGKCVERLKKTVKSLNIFRRFSKYSERTNMTSTSYLHEIKREFFCCCGNMLLISGN
jgi:hypothetical protein